MRTTLHGSDEDLAVTNLAGARDVDDGIHAAVHVFISHHDFDLHLGQEIHHILGATIELGMAFLAAKTLDFGHGQTIHPTLGQGLAHFLELEGLDDGGNHFHGAGSSID
jgi:hypothetical protein